MKRVIILIGPKGVGKSHIGNIIEKHLSIPFLRLEPIFIKMYADDACNADCYKFVEKEVARRFRDGESTICFESTGAAPEFSSHLKRLQSSYEVILIKITAPQETCIDRVMSRTKTNHLPVSREEAIEWNRIAHSIELPWNGIIENSGPACKKEILRIIRDCLRK